MMTRSYYTTILHYLGFWILWLSESSNPSTNILYNVYRCIVIINCATCFTESAVPSKSQFHSTLQIHSIYLIIEKKGKEKKRVLKARLAFQKWKWIE